MAKRPVHPVLALIGLLERPLPALCLLHDFINKLGRRFTVKAPIEKSWAHLGQVEQWPSWARHIRQIDLSPPGKLGVDTEGAIKLTNGIRSTFRMAELNEGRSWKWVGAFLWLTVHYDHQFKRTGPEESEIAFILDGEGFGAAVFGRIFAATYARDLDRAIPNLIRELEH